MLAFKPEIQPEIRPETVHQTKTNNISSKIQENQKIEFLTNN